MTSAPSGTSIVLKSGSGGVTDDDSGLAFWAIGLIVIGCLLLLLIILYLLYRRVKAKKA